MKHVLIPVLILLTAGLFADAKADAIMQWSLNQPSPKDMSGTSTMTITDRGGVVKVRKMKQVTKETADGTKSFAEFVEPADVNGTKFLTTSKKGSDTDQRIYLPAMKKVRKISASSKDGEFLGSDLTYFDMEKHYFEDATYTLVAENETIDNPAAAGLKLAKIATVSKDANAPYAKSVTWVDPVTGIPYRSECYDKKDGALLKVITIDEVKTIKDYLMTTKTTITNVKKGSTTVLTMANLVVDAGVKDSEVSVKRLEQ